MTKHRSLRKAYTNESIHAKSSTWCKTLSNIWLAQHIFEGATECFLKCCPSYISLHKYFSITGDSVDPHYLARAKILTREEAAADTSHHGFEASVRKCAKIGEKAARKRFSCVADTDFYETFANRVHMSRTVGRHVDQDLRDLAYKISKCSSSYSKYFERACKSKSKYLGERRRCRRMKSIADKSICRMQLRRVYTARS